MTKLVFGDRQSSDMHTGNVYATHIWLRIWGNGEWWFGGQLDDTSVLYGDNYAIGFSFEDGGYAGIKTGQLGADETSTPQHVKFRIEGRNEGLQRNYFQVLQGDIKFRLYRSGEPGQIFSDIGDDLKWLGRNIELMFSVEASDQGGDGSNPPSSIDHGIVDGGGGGGGGD
jgi:hypothetical protein